MQLFNIRCEAIFHRNYTRYMNIFTRSIAAISIVIFSTAASASGFSLGLILGEPTGLSAKQQLSNGNAIAGAAAWSLSHDESLQLHVDYLFNQQGLNTPAELRGTSHWYWGVGARFKVRDNDHNNHKDDIAGIRVPFGINFYPQSMPLELFGEIVPSLDVVPDSDFDLDLAIGVRYRFQ